jgi:FMN phosphatase YigB (HAD superfamily)
MARTVIFDLNRTLYDPFTDSLYPGARTMLEDLATTHRLFLYSKRAGDRGALVARLGIAPHFEYCHYVERKTKEDFTALLQAHAVAPAECIVVGDLVESELRVAGECGVASVWARHGICPVELPEEAHMPTYTADSIEELHQLLKIIA